MIGILFSIPYFLLFYASWFVSSLLPPLLVIGFFAGLRKPSAALRKLQMAANTVLFLVLSRDKKWKKPPPAPEKAGINSNSGGSGNRKTIIFVRHGESTWNDTFNPGDRSKLQFLLHFVPNLLKAIAYEWFYWIECDESKSWFYDSPLSQKGLSQASGIQTFLQSKPEHLIPKEAEWIKFLQSSESSQLSTSNLRRAISTLVVGFQDRLLSSNEKILLLPCLAEMSKNPDSLCMTPARTIPKPSTDPVHVHKVYKTMDTSLHNGNKALDSNGLKRMQEFCTTVFDGQTLEKNKALVCAGHSLWFRSFFQTYLPASVDHVCKRKKLQNGGIVGFTLERVGDDYRIDPDSLFVLYGGF
jgi:hypothetical protein